MNKAVGTLLKIKPAWLNHRTRSQPLAEVIEQDTAGDRARLSFQIGSQAWYPWDYIEDIFDEVPETDVE